VYSFFWGDFCDWYIEMVKLRLAGGGSDQERQAARTALLHLMTVFEGALRLLSPIMPFITEELWHAVYDGKPPLKSIALAAYPQPEARLVDPDAETEMAILQDLIVSVRNLRAELKVEPKLAVPIRVFAQDGVRRLVEQNRNVVEKLANVHGIDFASAELAQLPGARHTARFDVLVEYEKKVDTAAERERLEKDLKRMEAELANARRQLANQQFLQKAPAQVVEGLGKRAAELEGLLEKARGALMALR
jgi:valyl-tRNA synthetase